MMGEFGARMLGREKCRFAVEVTVYIQSEKRK
jgi:hypothetical protein